MEDKKLFELISGILKSFRLEGELINIEEIRTGHINATYRADLSANGAVTKWIVQRLNTFVFTKPIEVMSNIDLVTARIAGKHPDRVALRFEKTAEGKSYLFDADGGFWRVCNFIESVSVNTGADAEMIRRAGAAFGEFQSDLSGLDPTLLYETIPDFHNTRQRFRNLRAAIERDSERRAAGVKDEIAYYLSVEDKACTLTDLLNAGQLPLRVTHNDTKTNNVLFDKDTGEALAVIDLDTVMPGLIGSDFGDAVRFGTNPEPEDSRNLDKVLMDMDVFTAYADGFLSRAAAALTDKEIETLALSGFVLTVENGIRFLTDYLEGDVYFRVSHPEQNLDRARCQMALSKDMTRRMDEMNAIVRDLAEKYRG